MAELQFERAKAYLMRANKDGVSVYDEMTRLMELVLDENPNDVLHDPTRMSEILTLLQQHRFSPGESTASCNEASAISAEELERMEANKQLFERAPPEIITTVEQPDPYTTITTTTVKPHSAPAYTSVSAHNRHWTAAGLGMPDEEAFLLDRSITRLAMDKSLMDVRFVGKFFGLSGDYFVISSRRYVAQGEHVYREVNNMPRPPRAGAVLDVPPEPGYVGCNALSFWVTTYPSAPWVLLPDVTPQQINAARIIKRYLTGHLDAPVVSSPPFAWPESVYLRAQLSRIVSGTCIAPMGALEEAEAGEETDEDEEEDGEEANDRDAESAGGAGRVRARKEAHYRPVTVPSEEFALEDVDVVQLAHLTQWVHAERPIAKSGRQTRVPEKRINPDEEEEEEEETNEEHPGGEDEEEEERESEDESDSHDEESVGDELLVPIQRDTLFAVVDIPQPPPIEDELDDEEEEDYEDYGDGQNRDQLAGGGGGVPGVSEQPQEQEEDNTPVKPLHDEDIADDDTSRIKIPAWKVRVVNQISKAHSMVVVSSLRWPGAMAFIADAGHTWGSVYFGNGLKKSSDTFTPTPAPPVLSECVNMIEVADPTAATEKLVRRGEELPQTDSEEDMEDSSIQQ